MIEYSLSQPEIGEQLVFKRVFDDWLGPTAGLCRLEQGYVVAYLIHWQGQRLEVRTYALRSVKSEAADTWLHNTSRDYCDLSRKGAETDALIHAAAPDAWLVTVELPEMTISDVNGPVKAPAFRPWQELETP